MAPFFKKELNWSSDRALLYDDVSSNHPDLEIFLQHSPLLTDAMNDQNYFLLQLKGYMLKTFC